MKTKISDKFEILNSALTKFWADLEKQIREDKVTLVIASDFGRTITANSKDGSDHGWGGHYFILGGDVKGGQMLGKYPGDLHGDQVTGSRARLIPTTSWDSVWYGIGEWMGVDPEKLLDVIPGREAEINRGDIFGKDVLFKNSGSTQRSRRFLRQR